MKNNLIIITPTAEAEVKRLLQDESDGTGLRLGIKGGGCSGLSYILDFTEEMEGDTVLNFDGFNVFLDRKSTIYLSKTLWQRIHVDAERASPFKRELNKKTHKKFDRGPFLCYII